MFQRKNIPKKWERHQFDNFMTEKERKYVSSIFQRKINMVDKIYDYEKFFNAKKEPKKKEIKAKEFSVNINNENLISELKGLNIAPDVDLSSDKKVAKTKKICFIKSIKLPRLMLDSNVTLVDDIAVKLKIESMIDEFICKKYGIRESNLKEIFIKNENRIHEFFKVLKFRKLICDVFEEDDEEIKRIFFLAMLKKSRLIVDYGEISEFFDYLVSFIPEMDVKEVQQVEFFENFMFNLPGVLLATLLLINQEELAMIFFENLKYRLEYLFDVQHKYVWRFLAILIINVSREEKGFLIVNIKDKITEVAISNDQARIDDMNPFLEALGLEFKDLL